MRPMICGADLHDYWTTVINVEMHFNDLLASSRSLVASVMLAVFGAAIAATVRLKDEKIARAFGIPIGVLILTGGLIFLGSMYVLDQLYYYKLLLGAVGVAESIETQCKALPSLTLQLTQDVPREAATDILNLFYGAIFTASFVAMILIWAWDFSMRKAKRTSAK